MNTEIKISGDMSPLDIAENTESLYTPEEIAKVGATASFSVPPFGNQHCVDDWN